MLTINRRDGEGVKIDGPATVRIGRCRKSGRTQLRIQAERSVKIVWLDKHGKALTPKPRGA